MAISRREILKGLGATGLLSSFSAKVNAAKRLSVVTTTGMIADTACHIGGDIVSVHGLMGSGVDPHAYRQTRSDISKTINADLVLYHGLYLEAQMEEFLKKLARRRHVVAVASSVDQNALIKHTEYENRPDPHIWMVPKLWKQVANEIHLALAEAMPEARAQFEVNLENYLNELNVVQNYAEKVLATVPEQSRSLVTAHDAFGYFGRAFNYDVMGIQGISTVSESGLKRISELVDLLVERDIGAVFIESSVSDRNIRALIEGARSRGHDVTIGGQLFSDAMGSKGTYEGTYIGMIDHNATVIARALGGTAPAKGLRGALQQIPIESPADGS